MGTRYARCRLIAAVAVLSTIVLSAPARADTSTV